MADFDWAWPKQIDRDAVEAALRLDFLEKAHNVVLVANQGLGKTMIAQNIALAAVQAGHSVLFTTAAQMLLDLGGQESSRGLDQRLRHYCNRTGQLVIDEIGYLSYDNRNADLLFQVVSRRYEKRSVVLTTNLTFSDWPTVFPNAACTTALIDRLVHHTEIITIEGKSYRTREAEEAGPPQATIMSRRAALNYRAGSGPGACSSELRPAPRVAAPAPARQPRGAPGSGDARQRRARRTRGSPRRTRPAPRR